MDLIVWNEDLSVNIQEINEQHKKLISMINELNTAMGAGKGKDVMGSVLARLVDYTKSHFAVEETLMQKHQYPGYISHKAEHDKLTKQVIDIMDKFKEGKAIVTVEIMNFLKNWLTSHIQTIDKRYSSHLNAKGVA
jgi:hemerythrin-like metal-binding protein